MTMMQVDEDFPLTVARASIVTGSPTTLRIADSVLRMVAKPVPEEMIGTETLKHLVEEMWMCMLDAGGVGIAAPQVGISWRLFIATAMKILPSTVFVNPEVEYFGEASVLGEEGCLSVPGWRSAKVLRHPKVTVRYRDMAGAAHVATYEGLAARIVQHEFDHLNGKLFIDLDDSPEVDHPLRRRALRAMAEMDQRLKAVAEEA
ncbi:peptide deformylase [Pleomorphomonas sp. JP5]|uniref:peptide deformylase n=1 Tax=Pleomorphomonas sp. JP5 TaxID=2942998 RepID=UPI00204406CB|nr:peptide deformylase [Pleomorphomonas sp. JP5]MCM5556995.1 peptide deformylase [Pleomorphomonas sp. JP5]